MTIIIIIIIIIIQFGTCFLTCSCPTKMSVTGGKTNTQIQHKHRNAEHKRETQITIKSSSVSAAP
jgi:hypothetical protein